MYYLQSRYYDPQIGRFINADALVSTGQGVLGNNMFAYCLNNPINRLDISGTISFWFYLIIDHDMGFVHRMVVDHIRKNYGVRTEVVLSSQGRADVVLDGMVWEVKHEGKYRDVRILEAKTQAISYRDNNKEITSLGPAGYYKGDFVIACGDSCYTVSYSTPSAGVILYTVKEETGNNTNLNPQYFYVPKEQRNTLMQQMTYSAMLGTTLWMAGGCAMAVAFAAKDYQ